MVLSPKEFTKIQSLNAFLAKAQSRKGIKTLRNFLLQLEDAYKI